MKENDKLSRREAIRLFGFATAALGAAPGAVAGPFEAEDFKQWVPADKKLNPDWVRSLFTRGEAAVYRGEELRYIGMPVGGICAGQVYLGGDGTLWHWDIFNQNLSTADGHYANPPLPSSPFKQGFAIRIRAGGKTQIRSLDRKGFGDISFRGEYPIGIVEYSGEASPVRVRLEAFSPFIPLNPDDSSLPATLMQFTITNTGQTEIACDLAGWMENAVCLFSGPPQAITQSLKPAANLTLLQHSVVPLPESERRAPRPDILFENFEQETYEGWTVAGTAFGTGPVEKSRFPHYQGDVGGQGRRVVNSHASAPGNSIEEKDRQTGALLSRPFRIERSFINLWIGGGAHKDRTCVNLLVEGKPVASLTGANSNRMSRRSFDTREWEGKQAQIQIVDSASEAWGNIGVDEIIFSDIPAQPEMPLTERADYGTMGLALIGDQKGVRVLQMPGDADFPEAAFTGSPRKPNDKSRLCGSVVKSFKLAPGKTTHVTFAVVWHFPNLHLPPLPRGRQYANRFKSCRDVALYLSENLSRLQRLTRLWRDTWYRSTLPWWLLDRVFANVSTLATTTCHWLANGRFYGWEGVGCCAGTCAHVWHYAHAVARLFPQLERAAREMGDYGAGFEPETGQINFRAEHARYWAADGQAGCILRAYREHQMSADSAFLQRIWSRVKRSLEFLIQRDGNEDGILEGPQHNTLDADWFGQIAWLSGLYLAALRAGEEMAIETGDEAFARRCRTIFEAGRRQIDTLLFNGEYYYQRADPDRPRSVGAYNGCHIDQVFGQSWAWQVGLGRILDENQVKTALRSLWRYNYTPDVGPYRRAHPPGRWYAMPGEGGLLMCTWPRGDSQRVSQSFDFYFNECMNGFEYQAAWHMIAEGMVQEGLAVTRAIHDRYHPARRNPWNEVECGDHYARSMASYGVYLVLCGFEYHGPKKRIGFSPRLSPKNFRCAFTAAEGWGSYAQRTSGRTLTATLEVKWGLLRLKSLSLGLQAGLQPTRAVMNLSGHSVPCRLKREGERAEIEIAEEIVLREGQTLTIQLS
jgi:uncharacterized protein (DUF608 family)